MLEISDEARQKTRNELLDVTLEDIKKLAPVIGDVLADNYICVVGGQQAIEENKEEFNTVLRQ